MCYFVLAEGNIESQIVSKQKCSYLFDKNNADNIIGKLLFDPANLLDEEVIGDAEKQKKKAMILYVYNKEDNIYVATTISQLKIIIMIKFVFIGVFFARHPYFISVSRKRLAWAFLIQYPMQKLPKYVVLCEQIICNTYRNY